MEIGQKITDLRKSGKLDEAYDLARESIKLYPNDLDIKNSFGWVLYDRLKQLIEINKLSNLDRKNIFAENVREILVEYYTLKLDLPNSIFSYLLVQIVNIPKELRGEFYFFPKFIKTFNFNSFKSFRKEDLENYTDNENKVSPSLLEKVAKTVGQIAITLKIGGDRIKDSTELQDIQKFAISLIDYAFKNTNVRNPEWLLEPQGTLHKSLGNINKAKENFIEIVRQKPSCYWVWGKLAEIEESSERSLSLALFAKAYSTYSNSILPVNLLVKLSRSAAINKEYQIAKWSAQKVLNSHSKNQWQVSQSLKDILNAPWYSQTKIISDPPEKLSTIADEADRILWIDYPKYKANYIEKFLNKKNRNMFKFSAVIDGKNEEIVAAERKFLDKLNLSSGDPVILTIDDKQEHKSILWVEKRESGKIFDSLPTKTGRFQLKQGGFGFLEDIYIPSNLASKLQDGQIATIVYTTGFDKKKQQEGLRAIDVINK